MKKIDWIIAGISFLTSIAIFFAQGPYDNVWSYFIVFIPILAGGLILVSYKGIIKMKKFFLALLHAKSEYDFITSSNIKSTFRVRILNPNGDLHYERYFYIELIKNGSFPKTRLDVMGSEHKIDDFPPKAEVISSVPNGVSLIPCDISELESFRGGRSHFDYYWKYKINPPLKNKGDFLEYGYSAIIPKCEERAFTEEGALFFFIHQALHLDVKYSLTAPVNYCIKILDYWIEDNDGRRKKLNEADAPVLDDSGQMLSWNPRYRKGYCFICKYKFIKASVNWAKNSTSG